MAVCFPLTAITSHRIVAYKLISFLEISEAANQGGFWLFFGNLYIVDVEFLKHDVFKFALLFLAGVTYPVPACKELIDYRVFSFMVIFFCKLINRFFIHFFIVYWLFRGLGGLIQLATQNHQKVRNELHRIVLLIEVKSPIQLSYSLLDCPRNKGFSSLFIQIIV